MTDLLLAEVQSALGGAYSIERELGRGGMGAVYLARDLALDRPVAIKVLPPELAVRHELRERFLRESRTTAGFSHPNIVPVFAVVEQPELLGYVMAYVEGESVTAWVARSGPLSARDAVRMVREVAWGLSYAHGRGIIHRDVKPDNILVERATGRALVTDFGIARTSDRQGLTAVGEVVGTPQYMSPEQAAGDTLDGRSDLYSLGVVAWYALTGKPPFEATSSGAVMAMHLTQPLPPLAPLRPDLPRPLVDVIERMLAKEPSARFQTGEELVTALENVHATQREVPAPIRLFWQRLGLVGVASLILLVLGGNSILRSMRQGNDLDALIIGTFTFAVVFGLTATLVRDARQLLLRGFGAGDIQAGLRVVEAEADETRAHLRANPAYMRRLRIRRWSSLVFLAMSVAIFTQVLSTQRILLSPGRYGMTRVGVVTGVAATLMFGTALVTFMTSTLRQAPLARVMTRLWAGAPGRWLLRLAAWRLPTGPDARGVVITATPQDRSARGVFDALEAAQRRTLGGVRDSIGRLEREDKALEGRIDRLEQTLRDARTGVTPGADAAAALEAMTDEVNDALAAARAQRTAIATALERARLQLLRYKGGLGTAEEVRAALAM